MAEVHFSRINFRKFISSFPITNKSIPLKNRSFFLSVLIVGCFSGCKNTLDVNDKWKEVPVIFGLLDQSDSVQYVKIGKAFLGDASAYVMASNYDTVNYIHALDVKINEISNNTIINTFTLVPDSSIAKPNGI